jgi:hypothetical protein
MGREKMKTLQLSIIICAVIIFLGFGLESAHADNASGVYVQNIQVKPSVIKVGDTFTVTSTFVNNSTSTIVLNGGTCVPVRYDIVPLFDVTLDDHAKYNTQNWTCAGVGLSKILDIGKNITGTNPDSTVTYVAIKSGTSSVTVTYSYHTINQTDPTQSGAEQTISKTFQFMISGNKTSVQPSPRGGPSFTFDKISPLKQLRAGIKPQDVQCNGDFTLVTKAENNVPACVTKQTYYALVNRGWTILQNTTTTAWIFVNGIRYDVPYVIRGWNNDLSSSITFDPAHKSLIVPIKSVAEKGEITLTIPRTLLDSNLSGLDAPFVVLVDGQETKYTQVTSATARMLTIPFGFGAQKIEILAPQRI